MSKKKEYSPSESFTLEIDGKIYRADYTVKDDWIQVNTNKGHKGAILGGTGVKWMSERLLRELIAENKY